MKNLATVLSEFKETSEKEITFVQYMALKQQFLKTMTLYKK